MCMAQWSDILSIHVFVSVAKMAKRNSLFASSSLFSSSSEMSGLTDRRVSLAEDELLRIKIEGPPIIAWDPRKAVELWWTEKTKRLSQ